MREGVKKVIFAACIIILVFEMCACGKGKTKKEYTSVKSNTEFIFDSSKCSRTDVQNGQVADSVKTVTLYLGEQFYYEIKIPRDLDIITDNSKYIYAKDQSLSVSVVSNAPIDNLSEFAGIKKADSITPDLIRTKDLNSETLEAAKYVVNNKAIIVRTYSNPVAFNTMLEGLETEIYKVPKYECIDVDDKTLILNELPKYTGYPVTVLAGMSDQIQRVYTYTEGSLTILQETRKFEDAKDNLGTKLSIVTGKRYADKWYEDSEIFYVEKGEYTIAAINVNFNTTITLFAVGNEARLNLLTFVRGNGL